MAAPPAVAASSLAASNPTSDAEVDAQPAGQAGGNPTSPTADSPRKQLSAESALLGYWLLFALGLAAAFHELVIRQADAYFSPGYGPGRQTLIWSYLAGSSLGWLAWRRSFSRPLELLAGSTLVAAWALNFSAPCFAAGFIHPGLGLGAALTLPALLGLASMLAFRAALRLFGRATRNLSAFGLLLEPFRMLGLVLALGFAAAGAAMIGNLRSGHVLSMLLSVASLAAWGVHQQLFLIAAKRSLLERTLVRSAQLCLLLGGVGLAVAEYRLPAARLNDFPGELIYSARGERAEVVVTSSQDAFLLFVDGQLKRTQIDGYRHMEALVQPAMFATPGASQVLLLHGGTGLAEREVLRFVDVESLRVVVDDPALPNLAKQSTWLATASDHALEDRRVQLEIAEIAPWVMNETDAYDVIIADLPAPTTYEYGKLYTRYFFERLAELLTDDGTLVVSAPSAFAAPESYGSVVSTLRASGLNLLEYRVGIPLMGELSFILAGKRELKIPESDPTLLGAGPARFLNAPTLQQLFAPTPDTRPLPSEPNLLYEQPIVEHFRHELGIDPTPHHAPPDAEDTPSE
ncbi:MAG: hypothetical protein AB7K71_25140 [Polyangiaceae bacterium]